MDSGLRAMNPTVRYERPTFDIRSESDPQLAASLRSKFWTIEGLSGKLSNCTLEVDGDTVVFTGNVDATYQSLHAARPSFFYHLRYCLGTSWETACACLVLFLFCLAAVASLWAGSHLPVRVCCATAALCVFTYTVATSAILVPIVLILLVILNNLLGRSAKDKDGIGKALVFFCVSLIASRAMMVAVVKDIHIGAVYVHRPLVFTLSAINILAFVQLAHSLRRAADTLDIFPVREKTDRRVFIELSPSLLPYMTTVCEKLKAYQRCTPDAEADRIYGKPSYAVVCKESLEGNEYRIMRNGECLASKNFDEAQLDGFELNLLVCRAISARMDSDKEEKEISIFETQKTINPTQEQISIDKNELENCLTVMDSIFREQQERTKPFLSALLTRGFLSKSEEAKMPSKMTLEYLAVRSFAMTAEALKVKEAFLSGDKCPTQQEVAAWFGRDKTDASRTPRKFLEKMESREKAVNSRKT